MREQLAVAAAPGGAQEVAQQLVHQLVVRLLVKARAPGTFFDRQGQMAVVELDNEDGVENGRDALAWSVSGPRGGGPLSIASRRGSYLRCHRAWRSPARLPKARNKVPLPTPAAAATSSMDNRAGSGTVANSSSAAASTAARFRGVRPLGARHVVEPPFAKRTRSPYSCQPDHWSG